MTYISEFLWIVRTSSGVIAHSCCQSFDVCDGRINSLFFDLLPAPCLPRHILRLAIAINFYHLNGALLAATFGFLVVFLVGLRVLSPRFLRLFFRLILRDLYELAIAECLENGGFESGGDRFKAIKPLRATVTLSIVEVARSVLFVTGFECIDVVL
jgi:hypothetical protein